MAFEAGRPDARLHASRTRTAATRSCFWTSSSSTSRCAAVFACCVLVFFRAIKRPFPGVPPRNATSGADLDAQRDLPRIADCEALSPDLHGNPGRLHPRADLVALGRRVELDRPPPQPDGVLG